MQRKYLKLGLASTFATGLFLSPEVGYKLPPERAIPIIKSLEQDIENVQEHIRQMYLQKRFMQASSSF